MGNPLVILSGPTAVGKSALSVKLAQKINAGIISADSMQVYRGMDIGTAKITSDEMKSVPHYLIDIIDPTQDYNIVSFKSAALDAIADIYNKGRIPLIVGGTGFYIQSVLYDIDFTETEELTEYRLYLSKLISERGAEYVHKMLENTDPEAAKRIHCNDHKRMIRALEYNKQSGNLISEHNRDERERSSPYDYCYFVLYDDRSAIYNRINERVDKMIEQGLEDEVRSLLALGLTIENVSMQGLGYKEMIEYIEGDCTLEEAIYRIKRDTRHFAKRQLTWFKREKDVIWLNPYKESDVIDKMINILKDRGLIND